MKDGMAEADDTGDESELFFLRVVDVTVAEMLVVGVGGVAEFTTSWDEDADAFTLISVFLLDDASLTLTLPNSSRRASPIISEVAIASAVSSALVLFTPSSGGAVAADAMAMVLFVAPSAEAGEARQTQSPV